MDDFFVPAIHRQVLIGCLGAFQTETEAQVYAQTFDGREYGVIRIDWRADKAQWLVGQFVVQLIPYREG